MLCRLSLDQANWLCHVLLLWWFLNRFCSNPGGEKPWYVLAAPCCTPALRLGSPAVAGDAASTSGTAYKAVGAFYQSTFPLFPLLPSADATVNTFAKGRYLRWENGQQATCSSHAQIRAMKSSSAIPSISQLLINQSLQPYDLASLRCSELMAVACGLAARLALWYIFSQQRPYLPAFILHLHLPRHTATPHQICPCHKPRKTSSVSRFPPSSQLPLSPWPYVLQIVI